MSNLEAFYAEHRNLRAANASMLAFAQRVDAPTLEELNEARWSFTRILLRTLVMKERLVYPRLELHPDPQARRIAQEFRDSTDVDYDRFANHTKRFPPEMVRTDWRAYAVAVRMRTAELEDRMDREERYLFPLIAATPEISAPPLSHGKNWAADAWRVRALLGMDAPADRAA